MGDTPLKILHCFRSPIGGIFRHVRDLINIHAAQGHQLGILCDSNTGTKLEDDLFEALRPKLLLGLHRIPMRRRISPSDFFTMRNMRKQIYDLQPDILHGHGAKGGAYVRILGSQLRGSRSRVTRIYSPHGGSLHYDGKTLKGRFYFFLERLLESRTDALFFVSEFEKRAYFKKVGAPKVPHYLIYNGVNDQEFEPVTTQENASDFVYIGMMRDLKGPDIFVKAMRIAEKLVGRPLRAVMVGDGPDRENYMKIVAQGGLGDRIEFHHSMPVRKAFALADRVIVPSRAEALPYIVLETIAAQKPLIATRVGGIPEILGRSNEALVRPNDPDRLGALMALALEKDGWLQNCMPDPFEFKTKFSSRTMADKIMVAYKSINEPILY